MHRSLTRATRAWACVAAVVCLGLGLHDARANTWPPPKGASLQDPANWRPLVVRPFGDAAGKVVRVQTDPLPELKERQDSFVFVQVSAGLAGT